MTRRRLPDTRRSLTHRIKIEDITGGVFDLYIRTGYYDDSKLGEVWVNISKQGTTLQGLLDSWAKMLSFALQYGVPLEDIANNFIGDSFPPQGITSDGFDCSSLIDCVMQYLVKDLRPVVLTRR